MLANGALNISLRVNLPVQSTTLKAISGDPGPAAM